MTNMPEESLSVDHLLIFYEEKWHYFQAVWHENYQYSIHKFVISLCPHPWKDWKLPSPKTFNSNLSF